MPTDETLRGILEAYLKERGLTSRAVKITTRGPIVTAIQHRTWDAGYAAGIEAAIDVAKAERDTQHATGVQAAEHSAAFIIRRLDTLKAVPRG